MGGFWNISPIKELMTFSIWSSVGLLSDFWITLPSESSVSVLSPHFTVKEYFYFFPEQMKYILLLRQQL